MEYHRKGSRGTFSSLCHLMGHGQTCRGVAHTAYATACSPQYEDNKQEGRLQLSLSYRESQSPVRFYNMRPSFVPRVGLRSFPCRLADISREQHDSPLDCAGTKTTLAHIGHWPTWTHPKLCCVSSARVHFLP